MAFGNGEDMRKDMVPVDNRDVAKRPGMEMLAGIREFTDEKTGVTIRSLVGADGATTISLSNIPTHEALKDAGGMGLTMNVREARFEKAERAQADAFYDAVCAALKKFSQTYADSGQDASLIAQKFFGATETGE